MSLKLLAVVWLPTTLAAAQDQVDSDASQNASEEEIIGALEEMRDAPEASFTPADPYGFGIRHKEDIIGMVDELLRRYPDTDYREEALILKMQMLAHLARVAPQYVGQLLIVTNQIQQGKPEGNLAANTAHFSIQAFVLAARLEEMPEERRLLGALERYQAFVDDFPDSQYTPIMWASLIRNAVKLGRIDEARDELKKMQAKFPGHPATRRAIGEVGSVYAIDQPFVINMQTRQGEPAGTADYYGKVLIVHFWAGWDEKSVDELPELMSLYEKHKDDGLALLGINVDATPRAFMGVMKLHDLPWKQYFDGQGMANEIVVMLGITKLPAYYVVDRQGFLRAVNPREGLGKYVAKLLKEPVKPIKLTDPNAKKPKAETPKAETSKTGMKTPEGEGSKGGKSEPEKKRKPESGKGQSDSPPRG